MSTAEKNLQVLQGTNVAHQSLSSFNREEIDTIKRTVARGVSDAELSMFLTICGRYQLDPFLKEIWCYKRQKKGQDGRYIDDPNAPAIITTSRDGYLKVAQRDDNYDGIKSFVVKEGDTFEIDAEGDKVIHKFGTKRGKILGAWAAVYHKQRRPVIEYAEFEEYNARTTTWQNYPSAMIKKVAEALALKRQFGISGLVTQEEMAGNALDVEYTMIDDPKPQHRLPTPSRDEWLAAATHLNEFATTCGLDGDELRKIGGEFLGKHDPRQWSIEDMESVSDYLRTSVSISQEDTSHAGPEASIDGLPADEDLPF